MHQAFNKKNRAASCRLGCSPSHPIKSPLPAQHEAVGSYNINLRPAAAMGLVLAVAAAEAVPPTLMVPAGEGVAAVVAGLLATHDWTVVQS